MRLSKSLKQLIQTTARDAYAKGVADGERRLLTGLKAVAQLNGSFGAVAPLAGFARKAEPDDTHVLIVSAMLQVAEDAAESGDDPTDALKALAALSQDPDRLRDVLAGGTLQKAWDESLHPRDHGKFSSKPGAAGRSDGSGLDDSGNDLTDRPRSRSQAEAAAGVIRDILMGECGGDTKDWCVTTAEAVRAAFPDAEVWDGNYDGDGDQAHTIFKLGDWFVDVTADQFGGPDVFVARELPEDTYPDFAPTEAGRPAEVGRRMAAAMRSKFARRLEKAWDESLHPRDDSGRFIGKDKLQAAKSDPHLAQQLRDKTTDPGERAKLDKVLSGEADPGRTKRGEARHQSQQKRAATESDRKRAHQIAMRAFDGGLGYDDFEELAGLLPSLTVEQLRSVRAAVGASWGGQKLKRQGMVDTLVAFARQQSATVEQDAPGSPEWQARMMNREPQPKPGVDAWESAKVDDAADRAERMGRWEADRPDSEAARAVAGAARADLAGAREWAGEVATANAEPDAGPVEPATPDIAAEGSGHSDPAVSGPDRPKVEYVRAAAGGQVSEVDGKFYRGGQLMPVHGQYSGQQKTTSQPTGLPGGQTQASEDGEKRRREPARPLTPEQLAERQEEARTAKLRDEIMAGPLAKLGPVNPHTGRKSNYAGVAFKPWQQFAESVGEDRLKQIVAALPPPTDPGEREHYDWQFNHPQDFAATAPKKHTRAFPTSAAARFAVRDALDRVKSDDDMHRLHRVLTGQEGPPAPADVPAEPPMADPLMGRDAQLDIFGGSKRTPRPAKPAVKQSLVPREVERAVEGEETQRAIEAMRDAGNPPEGPHPASVPADVPQGGGQDFYSTLGRDAQRHAVLGRKLATAGALLPVEAVDYATGDGSRHVTAGRAEVVLTNRLGLTAADAKSLLAEIKPATTLTVGGNRKRPGYDVLDLFRAAGKLYEPPAGNNPESGHTPPPPANSPVTGQSGPDTGGEPNGRGQQLSDEVRGGPGGRGGAGVGAGDGPVPGDAPRPPGGSPAGEPAPAGGRPGNRGAGGGPGGGRPGGVAAGGAGAGGGPGGRGPAGGAVPPADGPGGGGGPGRADGGGEISRPANAPLTPAPPQPVAGPAGAAPAAATPAGNAAANAPLPALMQPTPYGPQAVVTRGGLVVQDGTGGQAKPAAEGKVAQFVATPWETPRGFDDSRRPELDPHGDVIEGRVGDVPISTERRGLIQKVSPATRKALEQAMADPVVRRAMEAANFTHLTLTDPRGEGKPDKWSAAKDAFGRLWIHPRTGDVIASSAVPERRAGGLGRVILHEAGHEHWDNAGPAKQKMFAAALAKSPELVDEIGRIVSLKTPKGAFDPDRDRTASEVHSELQAMRVYDPARYARLPAAIREAADAIYSG